MGGCMSQNPKPGKNIKKDIAAPKPIMPKTENFADCTKRQERLKTACETTAENLKQLEARVHEAADNIVIMPEYAEGATKSNLSTLVRKFADSEPLQTEPAKPAVEKKKDLTITITDTEKPEDKTKKSGESSPKAALVVDPKKDPYSPVPGVPISNRDAKDEEKKLSPKKELTPIEEERKEREETDFERTTRVLIAGVCHQSLVLDFQKTLNKESEEYDKFMKGINEEDQKKPVRVDQKFDKVDNMIAHFGNNSVQKFEKIYENKDLFDLVKELCCQYGDIPANDYVQKLIKVSCQDSEQLVEKRIAFVDANRKLELSLGKNKFGSSVVSQGDRKSMTADVDSPVRGSVVSRQDIQASKVGNLASQEGSPLLQSTLDQRVGQFESKMVNLRDIAEPKHPQGDDEVVAEDTDDFDDEPSMGLEKKEMKEESPKKEVKDQQVVIDAEEAARQASEAHPVA